MAKAAGFVIGLIVLGVTTVMVAAAELDPDAPISTARYGDEYPPAPLAGGPPDRIAVTDLPPIAPPRIEAAAAARPVILRVASADLPPEAPAPASTPRTARPQGPQRQASLVDGEALLKRISPEANDLARDRWVAYLAGADTAVALNLVRDSVEGFRRSGWSVENIAEYGRAQLGFGWRRKHTQVSLAATHREWSKIGATRRDVTVGVNVSVKP